MRWLDELVVPAAALALLVSFYVAACAQAAQSSTDHLYLPPADPGLYPHIVRLYGDRQQASRPVGYRQVADDNTR